MSDGLNNRRLKSSVAERIRERAANSGGNLGGGNGDSGGSLGGDSGGNPTSTATADSGQLRHSPTLDDTGNNDAGNKSGLKIIGGTGDRAGGRAGGDDGDSTTTTDNGRGSVSGEQTPLASADISRRVNLTEIMVDTPDGIRIVTPGQGKRGRKAGTTTKGSQTTSRKKSVDYSDVIFPLSIALDFVFGIPVQFGWGKHWELSPDENKELTENIKDVLEAFPSDTTTEFIKALEKFIPVLVLAINLYGLFSKRLKETKRLSDENQRAEKERTTTPFDRSNGEAFG